MSGKGSKPRPKSVSAADFDKAWADTFGKKRPSHGPDDVAPAVALPRPCPVPFPECGPDEGCPQCGGSGEVES
jgi:hypothetical protein